MSASKRAQARRAFARERAAAFVTRTVEQIAATDGTHKAVASVLDQHATALIDFACDRESMLGFAADLLSRALRLDKAKKPIPVDMRKQIDSLLVQLKDRQS